MMRSHAEPKKAMKKPLSAEILLKEKRCPYCHCKLKTILVYRKIVIRFRVNNYFVENDVFEVKCPRCGSDIKDRLEKSFLTKIKEWMRENEG